MLLHEDENLRTTADMLFPGQNKDRVNMSRKEVRKREEAWVPVDIALLLKPSTSEFLVVRQ